MLNQIINEKLQLIDKIDQLLEAEEVVCEDLDGQLQNGNLSGKEKGNIVKAKEKVYSAQQHEEQSISMIEKSIEKLQDASKELNFEISTQSP